MNPPTDLRDSGLSRPSLFVSCAPGDANANSDADLTAEFDPAVSMDPVRLVGREWPGVLPASRERQPSAGAAWRFR